MKTPFDEIFESLRFTEEEIEIFMDCLAIVKKSQEEDFDPATEIVSKVRGLIKDEI